MRNLIVVALIITFLSVLTSCSTYTCPTYAKAPAKVEQQEVLKKERL